MRFFAALLIIFGGLGVFAQTLMIIDGDMHRAVSGFALFISFASLGFLGNHYKRTNYKGGAPSIIGALLLSFGALGLVINIEEYGIARLNSVWGGVLFYILLLAGGFILVRSGHKSHTLKSRLESSNEAIPDHGPHE